MNQLFGWGVALMVIGALMGLFHFMGFLIGTTLSWIAGAAFIVGVILAIAGTARPHDRPMRA